MIYKDNSSGRGGRGCYASIWNPAEERRGRGLKSNEGINDGTFESDRR